MQENSRSWAFGVALCLLGPILFLSVVFSILAPLPILYLHQGTWDRTWSRLFAWASVPVGALICFIVKGPALGAGFVVLAGLPALVLGELLENHQSPEKAIGIASLFSSILLILFGFFYLKNQPTPVWDFLQGLTKNIINQLLVEIQKNSHNQGSLNETELQEYLKDPNKLLWEIPGILASAILLLHIIPMILLIRWNPKGLGRRLKVARDFLRSYSSPEWLVWPSIVCIAGLVFEAGKASQVASNLLKPLLVIYFFHGMSILAYFLDSFRLRGPLRYVLYSLGLIFLTPMIVSFGFFDLWFNFRSRFEPNV